MKSTSGLRVVPHLLLIRCVSTVSGKKHFTTLHGMSDRDAQSETRTDTNRGTLLKTGKRTAVMSKGPFRTSSGSSSSSAGGTTPSRSSSKGHSWGHTVPCLSRAF